MRVDGLIVGVASFILCGLFHVAVVKTEYYFTKKLLASLSGDGRNLHDRIVICAKHRN